MELDQRRTQALRLKAAVPLAQSMNQAPRGLDGTDEVAEFHRLSIGKP